MDYFDRWMDKEGKWLGGSHNIEREKKREREPLNSVVKEGNYNSPF